MKKDVILETKELKTYFSKKQMFSKEKKEVRAVDGISLAIGRGDTFGLVGESGCGKSTLGRTVLNLVPATSGEVWYNGVRTDGLSEKEMLKYRQKMQLIFQNPYSSLNPRMTIREAIESPLKNFGMSKPDIQSTLERICDETGIGAKMLDRFPHEFSGGQRQRIVIARALAPDPEFVVCDEPVSACRVAAGSAPDVRTQRIGAEGRSRNLRNMRTVTAVPATCSIHEQRRRKQIPGGVRLTLCTSVIDLKGNML